MGEASTKNGSLVSRVAVTKTPEIFDIFEIRFSEHIPEDNKKWLFGNSREIDLRDKSSK